MTIKSVALYTLNEISKNSLKNFTQKIFRFFVVVVFVSLHFITHNDTYFPLSFLIFQMKFSIYKFSSSYYFFYIFLQSDFLFSFPFKTNKKLQYMHYMLSLLYEINFLMRNKIAFAKISLFYSICDREREKTI